MSFTAKVKDELSRVEPACPDCERACLCALVRIVGTLAISARQPRLEAATETAGVARSLIRLLHGVYGLKTELTVRRSKLHKAHNFLVTVPAQAPLEGALRDLGVLGGDGASLPKGLVARPCCAASYLRGVFLAGGYIADPRGDFHFELSCQSPGLAEAVCALMEAGGIRARATRRGNASIVYLKGADAIISFLAFVGAHRSALEMENARVVKSVRNDTNRRVNAEIANQQKASAASMAQIVCIQRLVARRDIEEVPESLREVAMLRLKHPDASIKELGQYATPPLSKNAVYHRLLRIQKLAEG